MSPPPNLPPRPTGNLDPETVTLLKEYLRHAEENRQARKDDKILEMLQAQHNWQLEHDASDKQHFGELKGDIKALDTRMRTIESDVDKLQRNVEDTGRHNLTRLERELEARKARDEKRRQLSEGRSFETRQWMRRNWIPTIVTIAALALSIYETFFAHH